MQRTRATRRAAFHDRPWGEVEHARRNLRRLEWLIVLPLVMILASRPMRELNEYTASLLLSIACVLTGILALKTQKADRLISLRLGLCHACDADLRGIAPEPDGRTPCPRCGAAWRLESHGAGQV